MKKLIIISLCVLFACTALVHATYVPLADSGWAMVISPNAQITGHVAIPYVYEVTTEAVVIELDKTFYPLNEGEPIRPLIIEFMKIAPDATTNIVIGEEYIINNTGREWFDFHMHLMVDSLNPQAGFNTDFLPDGGQLEDVYYDINAGYENKPIQLNFKDNNGMGVPSTPPGDDVFQPGYVVGEIVIVTNPDMLVGDRFGLKEIPTIPEPATVMLLGFGVLGHQMTRKPNK